MINRFVNSIFVVQPKLHVENTMNPIHRFFVICKCSSGRFRCGGWCIHSSGSGGADLIAQLRGVVAVEVEPREQVLGMRVVSETMTETNTKQGFE